ncbi:MAG: Gfo/Idh/MocA family oxidoreductase [Spirochaetes bacterium]|nr:Gfo/Idh/MocA family oxidoreductase [Spirochaetota bacterium]
MMKKLKLGILGIGHMGQYHLNVASSLKNKFILTGIYDINTERIVEISDKYETKAYPTAEQLIDDTDAIIIAVPTYLHYKYTAMALERGRHVLVEKPVTENIEHARELAGTAKRKGLVFQVGHVERFNGAVQELHKIVVNPLIIETRRLVPYSDRIKDVGVVLDLMIHDIDIVMNIANSPVVSVQASGGSVFSDFEDYATAILQFESGCVASIIASRVTQRKIRTLSISQEKSYIFLDYTTQDIHIHRQASQAYLLTKEEIKYSQESFVEELFVHKENPLKQEHEYFYDCIINNVKPIGSSNFDIRILEVALEIQNKVRKDIQSDRLLAIN